MPCTQDYHLLEVSFLYIHRWCGQNWLTIITTVLGLMQDVHVADIYLTEGKQVIMITKANLVQFYSIDDLLVYALLVLKEYK